MARYNGTAAPEKPQEKARRLAALLGKMSEGERLALAAKLPSVVNPQGHVLTFHNTALLVQQSGREDLTMVTGFKGWIDAGRVVRKGERSVGFIMVPLAGKKRNGEPAAQSEGEPGEKTDRERIYFKFIAVFDISQTEELAGAEKGGTDA
jgi:antirestriction protein ArdC